MEEIKAKYNSMFRHACTDEFNNMVLDYLKEQIEKEHFDTKESRFQYVRQLVENMCKYCGMKYTSSELKELYDKVICTPFEDLLIDARDAKAETERINESFKYSGYSLHQIDIIKEINSAIQRECNTITYSSENAEEISEWLVSKNYHVRIRGYFMEIKWDHL